ncbi:unnamed protein product [Auanema sp. JU1783]|nr:unnamed protein product [Auanema sp. JU1783]
MLNTSSHCLTERQMMLAVNGPERLFIGTIVPILIVFGISGNILNLTVLLAPNMRTRSNLLLASLAVADIIFLIFMLPHCLAHYKIFALSYYFRLFYLCKMHLLAILNWASAVAIWLVLVICLERLMGIKYPLSVRKHKKILTPAVIVSAIVITTGILTSYSHLRYSCATRYFCDGTQIHSMCILTDSDKWFPNQTNPNSELVKSIARWGPHVNAIFVIFIPILLVLISNSMLIYTIRQRQKYFLNQQHSIKSESHLNGGQSRTEHKITITVTAIVTSFIITQGPSAFATIMAEYYSNTNPWMLAMMSFITTMVVLGKALNFVLFCLSSATFRSRLLMQTKKSLMRQTTRYATVAANVE